MAAETLQNVVDQVAEILRRVGKRDEIEEQVAQDVNFSGLIADLMKEEGPVRDTAIKIVVTYLKGYEIDTESDEAAEIIRAIDFEELMKKIVDNEEIQGVLAKSIKGALDGLSENGNFQEAVDEAFGLNDPEKLAKMVSGKRGEELQEIIFAAIKSHFSDFDVGNLDEDAQREIELAVFTKKNVQACLEGQSKEIETAIGRVVKDLIENGTGTEDDENPLTKLIVESETLRTAVDTAINKLVETGRISKLVEEVAESMLNNDNSALKSKLVEAISGKMVDKIAQNFADRLFERRM